MKNIIPVIVVSLFSTLAFAQMSFTCEELPALQQIVKDLETSCSKAEPTVDTKNVPAPETKTETTADTKTETTSDATTDTQVITGLCAAKGYVGNTASEAVTKCSAPGTAYNEMNCGLALFCKGKVPAYCKAKGYVADTAAKAIAKCSAPGTPYNESACGAALSCK